MKPSDTFARAGHPPAVDSPWSSADWRNVAPIAIALFHSRGSMHRPLAEAKVLHNEAGLHVHFRVRDRYVRVAHAGFQAQVYKDSCVEFFVRPGGKDGYLNFEMNAGGSLLASSIEDRTRTPEGFRRCRLLEPKRNDRIPRCHELPECVDPEMTRPVTWSIQCTIPWSLFADVPATVRR